ncbi:MAG: SDR family NAD(P)-dependent oxidoreductase [Gammaproteobacteria bacterium]|nr:SDR family NAD(P)-dependent oxidoreductase [Gammaproteobacteria bacterium]MCF6362672.1 SDR family NAD(P)-dependent oxidoreductase [Gammaproteobacteria bacterium]
MTKNNVPWVLRQSDIDGIVRIQDKINTGATMKLLDRTLLITGGTSGIGEALVQQLAQQNIGLVIIARNSAKLKKLAEQFSNIHPYRCSLASKVDVEKTMGEITDNHPDISVVINNAGIQVTPTFLDSDFDRNGIDNEITINLTAPIWICALMLGNMLDLKAPAAFVNITSGLALFPKKNSAVYCASKAGLRNFSRSLRYQLEETQISVHEAILPLVDTPMTEGRGKGKMSVMQTARAIIKGIENNREEIYVGKARLIPLLARISPSLMGTIMKAG